jgi:hypothetical protein
MRRFPRLIRPSLTEVGDLEGAEDALQSLLFTRRPLAVYDLAIIRCRQARFEEARLLFAEVGATDLDAKDRATSYLVEAAVVDDELALREVKAPDLIEAAMRSIDALDRTVLKASNSISGADERAEDDEG